MIKSGTSDLPFTGSLAMWYPKKVSVWKMKKLKQSSNGLSPSQYKISRSSLNLPTFISTLSKDLVG